MSPCPDSHPDPGPNATLTPQRIKKLCAELRASRAKAIARFGSEYAPGASHALHIAIFHALVNLVGDLGGFDAMHAVNAAFDDAITPDEIEAQRIAQASAHERYLAAVREHPKAAFGPAVADIERKAWALPQKVL